MSRSKPVPIDRGDVDAGRSYGVTQVAECVGYYPGHLKRLIRQGRVKAFRPNGHEWRVLDEEVVRMAEAKEYTEGCSCRSRNRWKVCTASA